ncbi:hypothetical protein RCL1_003552 [Eukaryota sp. TZLM3-RCL]
MPNNDLRKHVLQSRINHFHLQSQRQPDTNVIEENLEERRNAIRTRLTNLLARSEALKANIKKPQAQPREKLPPISQNHFFTSNQPTRNEAPPREVPVANVSLHGVTKPVSRRPVTHHSRSSKSDNPPVVVQRKVKSAVPLPSIDNNQRQYNRTSYSHTSYNQREQSKKCEEKHVERVQSRNYEPVQPQAKPKPPRNSRNYDQTIESVCGVLNQVIIENQRHLKNNRRPPPLKCPPEYVESFNEASTPGTPCSKDLYKFLFTFAYRTRMNHETAVAMLAYVDRLIEKSGLVLCSRNWKRVVFSAILLAQKYHEDESFFNSDYNKLFPELSLEEVIELERSFLALVDFDLSITPDLYSKYQKHLQILYNNELDLQDAVPYSPLSPSFMPELSSSPLPLSKLMYSEVPDSPVRRG